MKQLFFWVMLPIIVVTGMNLSFLAVGWKTAELYGYFLGYLVAISIPLIYIVFWDSKKRWPDKTAFQRYARIITFYSD